MGKKQIGQRAEGAACAYLIKQGLRLVKRNFLCKVGEIDLIMRHDEVLVFVEVRYRKLAKFGHALESVTWHKQQKVIKAAEYFLLLNKKYASFKCRFDVISIMPNVETPIMPTVGDNLAILWVKNAFQG